MASFASKFLEFICGKVARKRTNVFKLRSLAKVGILIIDGLDDGTEFIIYVILWQIVFELASRIGVGTISR